MEGEARKTLLEFHGNSPECSDPKPPNQPKRLLALFLGQPKRLLALFLVLGPDGTLSDTEAGYAFYQNLWEINDRRWFNQEHEQVVPALQVVELNADSNAAQAGISIGDEILLYNHQRVEYYAALTWMIRHQKEGPVDVGVLRDGKLVHLPASSGPLGVRLREHYIPLSDLIIAEAAKAQSTRRTE